MKIGILTAMMKEHDQIAALLEHKEDIPHTVGELTINYVRGTLNGNEIILRQCGIGKVNAAVGTAELIRTFSPDCVISTGVAGGIDTCLDVMDVVVSDRTVHHDFNLTLGYERGEIQGMPRFFDADPKLVEAARQLGDPSVHIGLICTGDQFVSAQADMDFIKANFPEGLGVDMESAAIAQTCYLYHVPFVSFRIISDTPGADKHKQQYENFWEDMAQKSFGITKKYLLNLV